MMGSGLSLFIKDHTHTQTSRSVEPLCTLCTASPAVLSIWLLQKCFSHPSLVIYVFATPPIKLKLGYQICEGLLIANHLDESLWWANQKHWSISHIFSVGTHWCLRLSPATANHFPEPNPQILTFLHPILLCRITYWALLEMFLAARTRTHKMRKPLMTQLWMNVINIWCFTLVTHFARRKSYT
jgi:hypothetical protein